MINTEVPANPLKAVRCVTPSTRAGAADKTPRKREPGEKTLGFSLGGQSDIGDVGHERDEDESGRFVEVERSKGVVEERLHGCAIRRSRHQGG
jgi:hypothetical protein